MDRIVIFLILLLMALGYAFWKGGGPERCMAAIMLSMLVFDQALHLIIPAQFASLDAGHLLIDVFAAVTTVSLALVAHRFWPMIAAVFQVLPLLAHFSRVADLSMQPIAYLTMQEIGRASCRERVCQYGSSSVVAVSVQKKKRQ